MSRSDDPLDSLREALRLSPDNIPLRQHLAETLLGTGRPEEAEFEYRQALALSPHSVPLKLGLARAFFQQEKDREAFVLIEDFIKQRDTPAAAYLLHTRLLLRRGDVERAVSQYKMAIDQDPEIADAEIEHRLGISDDSEHAEVVDGKLRAGWGEGSDEQRAAQFEKSVERPSIAFNSVGGMEELKEEIRLKIIHPLNHPEIYKAYGKPIGGGILMYGPPGCGKTHLARATAGEIHASFISVGISEVLDMWIGSSERNLHALFEQARQNTPCVLFFDEVDALGSRRSDMLHSAGRHLVNQFLDELDGVKSTNEGVLVLAATNAPWHLDSAFRRPGRFDRILFVPPPDAAARASIFRVLCRGKPIEDLDYAQLGKKTEGCSGADLKGILDVAIEQKLQAAMKDGIPKPLTTRDLLASANILKPSTREWFASARNHALYSNQGGIYDDILKYLKLS